MYIFLNNKYKKLNFIFFINFQLYIPNNYHLAKLLNEKEK